MSRTILLISLRVADILNTYRLPRRSKLPSSSKGQITLITVVCKHISTMLFSLHPLPTIVVLCLSYSFAWVSLQSRYTKLQWACACSIVLRRIVISEFYYVTDLYSACMHFEACTLNHVDVQFRVEFRTQFTKNSMPT